MTQQSIQCQRCTRRAVVEREPFTGRTREYCPRCGHSVTIVPRRLAPPEPSLPDPDDDELAAPRPRRGESRERLLRVLPQSRAAARNAQQLADESGLSHGSVSSILGFLCREGMVAKTRIENPQHHVKGWRIVTGYWRVA